MMSETERLKQMNWKAIEIAISRLDVQNYDTVSELLPNLLISKKLTLNTSIYKPADSAIKESSGIGRYLIYDNPDKANPFSIWIFVFAPKQRTCIHDHKFKCTVTVLEGAISETFFQPITDEFARLIGEIDRQKFHTNRDDLSGFFAHQLKHRQELDEGFSMTLHIYNMPAYVFGLEGERFDNRNLNKIYTQDTSKS